MQCKRTSKLNSVHNQYTDGILDIDTPWVFPACSSRYLPSGKHGSVDFVMSVDQHFMEWTTACCSHTA